MADTRISTAGLALALMLAGCGDRTASGDQTAEQNDAATLAGAAAAGGDGATNAPSGEALAMGNDTSEYANDGECDDPRFEGAGMASALNTDNIGRDAADCGQMLSAGNITPNPLFASDAADNFGDDAGTYPNDDECDDIRYTGAYSPELVYVVDNIGHDASDCRAAVESGVARWQGGTVTPEYGKTLEELEAEQ